MRVAGQNVKRQTPPTAKGSHFVILEAEDGFMNGILRPSIYARYRRTIGHLPFMMIEGKVQCEGAVTNVLRHAYSASVSYSTESNSSAKKAIRIDQGV